MVGYIYLYMHHSASMSQLIDLIRWGCKFKCVLFRGIQQGQAFTWTNDGYIYLCIYVSLGLSVSNPFTSEDGAISSNV